MVNTTKVRELLKEQSREKLATIGSTQNGKRVKNLQSNNALRQSYESTNSRATVKTLGSVNL